MRYANMVECFGKFISEDVILSYLFISVVVSSSKDTDK